MAFLFCWIYWLNHTHFLLFYSTFNFWMKELKLKIMNKLYNILKDVSWLWYIQIVHVMKCNFLYLRNISVPMIFDYYLLKSSTQDVFWTYLYTVSCIILSGGSGLTQWFWIRTSERLFLVVCFWRFFSRQLFKNQNIMVLAALKCS